MSTTTDANRKTATGTATGTATATGTTTVNSNTNASAPAPSSTTTTAAATTATTTAGTTTTTPGASTNVTTVAVENVMSLKKLPQSSVDQQSSIPPNSFREVLNRLDDEKQISYLMLGASEVLTEFSVKRTHPYSYFFFKKKGYKQIFQPNKNLIVQEIKRRNPEAKPNQNNRSNDELMEMLRDRWPLQEPDKKYLIAKEQDYRKALLSALNPKEVIHLDELVNLTARETIQAARKRSNAQMDAMTQEQLVDIPHLNGNNGRSLLASPSKRRAGSSSSSTPSSTTRHGIGNIRSSALETLLIQTANDCAGKVFYCKLAEVVEALKKERFDLNLRKASSSGSSSNDVAVSLMSRRIQEISDSIVVYEAKMSGRNGVSTASVQI